MIGTRRRKMTPIEMRILRSLNYLIYNTIPINEAEIAIQRGLIEDKSYLEKEKIKNKPCCDMEEKKK